MEKIVESHEDIRITDIYGSFIHFVPILFTNRLGIFSENDTYLKTEVYDGRIYKMPIFALVVRYLFWIFISLFITLDVVENGTLLGVVLLSFSVLIISTVFFKLKIKILSIVLFIFAASMAIYSYMISNDFWLIMLLSMSQIFNLFIIFSLFEEFLMKRYKNKYYVNVDGISIFVERNFKRVLDEKIYINILIFTVLFFCVELLAFNFEVLVK